MNKYIPQKMSAAMLAVLLNISAVYSQPENTPYSTSNHTIYDVMFQLVDNDVMPTYIAAFPYVRPAVNRVKFVPKDEGGKNYITEISPNLIYTVFRGRPRTESWRQRNRVSIVYNPTLRMVISPNSNPILPTNQKAGFRYDFILKNKHENDVTAIKDTLKMKLAHFDIDDFSLKNLPMFVSHTFTFHAMHYSNGQTDTVPNSQNPKRNNYQNGDFSTNYLNVIYTASRLDSSSRINQFSAGFQWDWGIKNFVLGYTETQEKEYGHFRLLAGYQFNSRPRCFCKPLKRYTFYNGKQVPSVSYKRLIIHKFRVQGELILDNVSNYRPDLKSKYPFGINTFYEIDFPRWRNVGFFAQGYLGRDYLNIRYDDVIWSLSAGVTLRFKKIFPVYYNDPEKLKYEKGKCCGK